MHFFFLKFMMEITFTQENYFSAVLEKPVFKDCEDLDKL